MAAEIEVHCARATVYRSEVMLMPLDITVLAGTSTSTPEVTLATDTFGIDITIDLPVMIAANQTANSGKLSSQRKNSVPDEEVGLRKGADNRHNTAGRAQPNTNTRTYNIDNDCKHFSYKELLLNHTEHKSNRRVNKIPSTNNGNEDKAQLHARQSETTVDIDGETLDKQLPGDDSDLMLYNPGDRHLEWLASSHRTEPRSGEESDHIPRHMYPAPFLRRDSTDLLIEEAKQAYMRQTRCQFQTIETLAQYDTDTISDDSTQCSDTYSDESRSSYSPFDLSEQTDDSEPRLIIPKSYNRLETIDVSDSGKRATPEGVVAEDMHFTHELISRDMV